jgi:hypothetical protein
MLRPRCDVCDTEIEYAVPFEEGDQPDHWCPTCRADVLRALANVVYDRAYPDSISGEHRTKLLPEISAWLNEIKLPSSVDVLVRRWHDTEAPNLSHRGLETPVDLLAGMRAAVAAAEKRSIKIADCAREILRQLEAPEEVQG